MCVDYAFVILSKTQRRLDNMKDENSHTELTLHKVWSNREWSGKPKGIEAEK